MALTVDEIVKEAEKLSAKERVALVERLVISLDEDTGADTAQVEAEWKRVARRRMEEIKSGTAKTVSSAEVFEKLREKRSAAKH